MLLGAFGLTFTAPQQAEAQCVGLCASANLQAGVSIGGSIQIGTAPPPPAVVYVQPAPAPPPVMIVPAPQPPIVYVQPAPAPVPAPAPAPAPVPATPPTPPRPDLGVRVHLGGVMSDSIEMGGLGAAFRVRPDLGHLAVDLGLAGYGGVDEQGRDRGEFVAFGDLLFFINPRSELQVYALAGLGVSSAHVEGVDPVTDKTVARDMGHVNGSLGLGLELRISDSFAINGDLRGFVRSRVDDDPEPEFIEVDDDGRFTGRTTDTSGGGIVTVGATFYF